MSADSGSALPARTTRYRRRGRHSSPHQLSLPTDSPALVIAVPGSARPESEDTAVSIADQAAASCQGAEVRIGFLRGGQDSLEEALEDLPSRNGLPAGVVVPLLPFPYPEVDRAIAAAVAAAEAPFVVADHLGPHPLLAEALHVRMADVGLARAARVGRISIVTAADGVIVGAVGDEEAVQAAEVVAVLLASRLTTPVAAASLTDPGSIKDAATRLRQAVPRVALAPCMVGPELTSGTLEAIAALTSIDALRRRPGGPEGGGHGHGDQRRWSSRLALACRRPPARIGSARGLGHPVASSPTWVAGAFPRPGARDWKHDTGPIYIETG